MGGLPNVPVKAVVAIVGAVLLLLVAFRAPLSSESSEAAADEAGTPVAAADATVAGDGASVGQATTRSGVTTPPEPRNSFVIPQPQPGQKPIQTVVVSVDGGCETADGTIREFMDIGKQVNGRFTFFLSGLCLLPDAKRMQYRPPGGKLPGQSDVGFATAELVDARIRNFTEMWREGHEIGTHFLGHFCGASGVETWDAADWTSEIEQARGFLDNWVANNPQVVEELTLPFDSSVFQGDRTPCLEGQRPQMWQAFIDAGFRYEASDPGTLQWPRKVAQGQLWQFPLPALKLSGTDIWTLAMDYNFLVNQTDGRTEAGPEECARVEQQNHDTYMDALDAVYNGNRAPLFIGTHLNDWICGAYITSLHRFIVDAKAKYPDVEFVTNLELADWLDAMDPATLKALQKEPAQRY